MSSTKQLEAEAERLAGILQERNLKIVFAESCTGGLIAATLTRIPGISSYLCGSAVVYQIATKANWLGIAEDMLDDPGPVSPEVAQAMAEGVLRKTPQADLAASVTGHLGPDAPEGQDGLIYVAVAVRGADVAIEHFLIPADASHSEQADPLQLRLFRQREAARIVLSMVCQTLE